MPSPMPSPTSGPMLVLAHRGASQAAVENTPAAFRLADAMGADGVELDVRLAADGSLVVSHDPLPTDASATDVPSLGAVLDACGGRMLVNVEIKNLEHEPAFDPTMAIADATIAELRRRADDPGRWLISSFSRATVDHCRQRAPELATAALCLAASSTELEQIAGGGHAAVHPAAGAVDEALVVRAHDLGLAVNVWTVNDADRLRQLRDLGVDGVCTDVPDVALAALDRSGAAVNPRWGRPA
jgi:glycerophosphoryl diester phosphodiesterase